MQRSGLQLALVPARSQAKQVVVKFFCIKKIIKMIISGVPCEATHICALYVGQMCVHFFMKTKLDSVSFLQPERENHKIHMPPPEGMSLREDPEGDACAGEGC